MSSHHHHTTANKQVKDVTLTVGDDPTNTAHIQEGFIREIQRRFREFRGLIRQSVGYKNDALNLSSNADELEDTPPGKSLGAAAFIQWVKETFREVVLGSESISAVQAGEHWTASYLNAAAKQGWNQATGILFQKGVSVDNVPDDEILDIPVIKTALRGGTGRYYKAFADLKDISDETATEIGNIIEDGFQNGWNPKKMADEMTETVRNIEHTRAVTLARTETVNAHSQASIANYKRQGVNVVGHVSRFVTPDDALCPFCRRLRDVGFTISEFQSVVVEWRGQTYRVGIPSHPNGRCAPDPIVGGTPDDLESLEQRLQTALGDHTIINR